MRAEIAAELEENLLPFWRQRSEDSVNGGFINFMAADGTVDPDAPRGLILNSRLLWAFSALYRRTRHARDLELAERAHQVLQESFLDREHGGYLWRVDARGRPLTTDKKTYGQAFCIYALSEYFLATGDQGARAAAWQVFDLVEVNAFDWENGGYLEARARDWTPAGVLQLAPGDMNAAKSMNTHLHLLEAYTNLYRAWPDRRVAERLVELIETFGSHLLVAGHLRHFFDEHWQVLSDSCTYGHDIEAAWLLGEAADVIRDKDLVNTVNGWTATIARAVLDIAVGPHGGIFYEGRLGEVVDRRLEWWCQAEAVVGFWYAYQLTGEPGFRVASEGVWRFISQRMVDRLGGEWFWRIRADGVVDDRQPKVSEWKGPYHTVRMCLEMMRRLDADDLGGVP